MNDVNSLIALSGLLFVAVLSVFLLAVYKYLTTGKFKNCIADSVIFILLVFIASYVSGATISKASYSNSVSEISLIALSLAFIVYSVISFFYCRRKNKNSLSPFSVKEALDNLNSGICFADETGRIVLINHAMSSLMSAVLKTNPQTQPEISSALASLESSGNGIYAFPDGSVWLVNISSLDGYTQTAARNVTELVAANVQLERENERLKKTNEEMQIMLERLADRIREQETLNLKMQIHNDIGSSLIAITNIMNGKTNEPLDEQLRLLQNAVGYFSNEFEKRQESVEEVRKNAKKMGVRLVVTGALPESSAQCELIALAAMECVTNCVKHAGGNEVYAVIDGRFVSFTNNGEAPKKEITEGGGLTSLRKRIENAGGAMKTSSAPVFTLTLELPETENRYD